MLEHDPYATPAESTAEPREFGRPSNKRLWLGFAIAPLVGPVLFAVVVFVGGLIVLKLNPDHEGTPIGIILVPIFSLTAGVVLSYGVAGVIGMPIAFHLRRCEKLNGYTIHGAALLCGLVFVAGMTACIYAMTTSPRPAPAEVLLPGVFMFLVFTPCILLSATTFWWIVSRHQSPNGMDDSGDRA